MGDERIQQVLETEPVAGESDADAFSRVVTVEPNRPYDADFAASDSASTIALEVGLTRDEGRSPTERLVNDGGLSPASHPGRRAGATSNQVRRPRKHRA